MAYVQRTINGHTEYLSVADSQAFLQSNMVAKGWEPSDGPPTPAFDVAAYRTKRKAAITAECDAAHDQPITVDGYTLAATASDRSAFTSQAMLISQQLDAGEITDETIDAIKDASGAIVTLPVSTMKALLRHYGAAFKTRWIAYETMEATKHAAIDAAQTKAEIDAITWS